MATSVHLYDASQWILDHYKPLLWTHGITFYARPDQPPASQVDASTLTKMPLTQRSPSRSSPAIGALRRTSSTGAPASPGQTGSGHAHVRPAP